MKKLLFNFGMIFVSVLVSLMSATFIGTIYGQLFPENFQATWIGGPGAWEMIIGFPLALIFFLSLGLALSEKSQRYLLAVILVVPVLFELYFDLGHIYIPIILGLVGYSAGWMIRKIVWRT